MKLGVPTTVVHPCPFAPAERDAQVGVECRAGCRPAGAPGLRWVVVQVPPQVGADGGVTAAQWWLQLRADGVPGAQVPPQTGVDGVPYAQ